MLRSRLVWLVVVSTAALVGAWPAVALAATQPALGTAINFAVLAGSTITNTGSSVITGNLGLQPGTSVTGFPPGTVTGVQHIADAVAVQAQTDLATGYTEAASASPTSNLSGQDLGGKNLTPGVYSFSSSAQLTGSLTLSGNGVYVFQIGSTLTTASNSVVLLSNGAQACAVYWQVGSSATLGSATHFQGNLMALTSITLDTGANILTGRALARNGALTLDSNQITPPSGTCTVPATPTPSPSATAAGRSATPSPAIGLPNTGGPPSHPGLPWWPLAIAAAASALLLALRVRAQRKDS